MFLYLAWFFISVYIFFYTLKSNKKKQIYAMAYFMVALGVFIGLGDMLGGYDRYIYGELFDDMADVTRDGGNPWLSYSFSFYGSEFGYGTLSAIISFFTSNRYIFIFILTLIIYILLISSLKEYADNAPFAMIMFMGLWMFFTFTYLRQVLGCTIAWLSVKYIIERDLKKFLLVLFIAFSFHNSAIIFLPMYFFPIRKYTERRVILTMIIALFIGLSPIPQGLFEAYGEIDAGRIHEDYAIDQGFRFAYLFEAMFFLFVILVNYRNIPNKPQNIVMLNTALVFCAILLIFVRSENGGRLSWFYMIGLLCTLSNICIVNKKIIRSGLLMIVVSLALYLRVYISWQEYLNLYPYKTFLTDGHREGDYSWERYEYDHNYDINKFYRK